MVQATEFKKRSTPDEAQGRTSRDIVIYDGECNFCVSQIQLLRRWDRGNRLEFVSLHDPSVYQSCSDLSFEELMSQMWLVTSTGRRYGGADALRYLTRRLPILYPLAPLMHIPGMMPIWRRLYRLVARNRYRLAGKHCNSGACARHANR